MKNIAVSAVVGMGLLIIIITIFIIYGLIQKSDDPDFKFFDLATESVPETSAPAPEPAPQIAAPAPSAATSTPTPTIGLGDLRYDLPAGFKVVSTEMGHSRLMLQLENAENETRLMILDLNNGSKIGTITLAPTR